MRSLLTCFVTVLLLCNRIHAMFSSSMTHLNHRNFKSEVMDTEKTVMVMYYSPQCGHCHKMKPAYEKAARTLKGIGKVVAVDCVDQAKLCAESFVKGYPTVKGYYTSSKSRKRITVEYPGDRTAQSLVSFVHDKIPSFVKHIRPDVGMDVDRFYAIENTTIPKVIVVKPPTKSNISKPRPLLRSLAIDYHYRLLFGELSGPTESDPIYKSINVTPDPKKTKVLVVQPGSNEVAVYEGVFKRDLLVEFFDKYALSTKLKTSKKKSGSDKTNPDTKEKKSKKKSSGDKASAATKEKKNKKKEEPPAADGPRVEL